MNSTTSTYKLNFTLEDIAEMNNQVQEALISTMESFSSTEDDLDFQDDFIFEDFLD